MFFETGALFARMCKLVVRSGACDRTGSRDRIRRSGNQPLEAVRGGQAFNKQKRCEIVSRHSSITQYPWFSSSFSPKPLSLHTASCIHKSIFQQVRVDYRQLTCPQLNDANLRFFVIETLILALTSCILTRRFRQFFRANTDMLLFRLFANRDRCRQAVSLHLREMALKIARFSKRQKGLGYVSFET